MKKIRIILSIGLGLFFIYKGFGKLTSDKLKTLDTQLVKEYIIDNDSYAPPVGYKIVMNTFKQSGYLAFVSIFQMRVPIDNPLVLTLYSALISFDISVEDAKKTKNIKKLKYNFINI